MNETKAVNDLFDALLKKLASERNIAREDGGNDVRKISICITNIETARLWWKSVGSDT